MFLRFIQSAFLLVFLTPAAALGQDPAPTELLQRDVGIWDVEFKLYAAPGGEPVMGRGTETNRMLGDAWLIGEFTGEIMGQTFHGLRRTSFDVQGETFVTSWIDSTSPYATIAEGTWDEATQTMTLFGEGRDPFGNEISTKTVVLYDHDGSRVSTMYATGNGAERKMIEFRYTKAADDEHGGVCTLCGADTRIEFRFRWVCESGHTVKKAGAYQDNYDDAAAGAAAHDKKDHDGVFHAIVEISAVP